MIGTSKKILVVDDEPKIAEVVTSYLINSGYSVFEAFNGRQALELFDKESPSLVVLDLMLPDISGENICRIIREKSNTPIIMLTAKIEENNILQGLSIGADDYITKPFSPRQLVARIAAVLRRVDEASVVNSDTVTFNNVDLIVDFNSYDAKKNGVPVNLTPNEFKLLKLMVKHPNKVFTRDELISLAIGDDFEGYDRIIDTHIKNIRQKIETNPRKPHYILTVHGIGYKFNGDVL